MENNQTTVVLPATKAGYLEQEIPNLRDGIEIYHGASTLKITDGEQKKLLADFPEDEIEIRPDGLIYLPQTFWRRRLNESFGIGQWCLVVISNHKDPDANKDKLYLHGALMVRGCYVAEAVGEAELHSGNPQHSWASVWESAKSDCITRCCKDLGIASALWQPQFIQKWIKENAMQVWREKVRRYDKEKKQWLKGSYQWRKKTADPFYDEAHVLTPPVKEAPVAVQPGKSDARPWLTEKQYSQALSRISRGELDVYSMTIKEFRMKRNYRKMLDDAYGYSKSFVH